MDFATLPRRVVNAAVVFVQRRMVCQYAQETEQSRDTIYRDARAVAQELEQAESLRNLQRRNEELAAEIARLQLAQAANPFTDPDKVAQYAAMAQAEGVSLPVARRLLIILQESARPR
jgi:hypothetical protein